MSAGQIPWTEEETARLMRVYRKESAAGYRKTSWVNIVREMPGRTRAQCQGKIRYQIHGHLRAQPGKDVRHEPEPRARTIPSEVIADAHARRFLSHRSLTSALCGDPLPGRSALERREPASIRAAASSITLAGPRP